MNEEKPPAPVRSESEVDQRVRNASDEILKVIDLKGETNQAQSPFVLPCSGYPTEAPASRLQHTWIFSGASDKHLQEAMGRLRKELPSRKWKIIKDGPDGSQNNSPQIVADSEDGQLSTDLRLHIRPPGGEYGSEIEVHVQSQCYGAEPTNTPAQPTP